MKKFCFVVVALVISAVNSLWGVDSFHTKKPSTSSPNPYYKQQKGASQPDRSYYKGGSLYTQGSETPQKKAPTVLNPDQVHQMYHQKAYPSESSRGPIQQQSEGSHFYHPGGTKVPRFMKPQSQFHPGTHAAHSPGSRPYVQEDQYKGIPNSGLWHRPSVQGESEIYEKRFMGPSQPSTQVAPSDRLDQSTYVEPTSAPLEYYHRQLPQGSTGSAAKQHPVKSPHGQHMYTHTDRSHYGHFEPYYPGIGPPAYAQKPDSTGRYYPYTTRRGGDLFYEQEDYASEYGSARLKNEAMQKNIRNDLNRPNVTVSVHDGVVVLTGVANSNAEKNDIERQVRSMPGVTSVRNDLRITRPAGR
jgi:hypothetical protein